jgi:hypothetical protein
MECAGSTNHDGDDLNISSKATVTKSSGLGHPCCLKTEGGGAIIVLVNIFVFLC